MGRKKIEEIVEKIGEKAKTRKGAVISQQGTGNVAVVGNNNVIHTEKLSNKELRNRGCQLFQVKEPLREEG